MSDTDYSNPANEGAEELLKRAVDSLQQESSRIQNSGTSPH